jgi:hypothetical protein
MTKARDIASAAPAPSTVSATELGYLDGVTSAIQTQLDAKTAKSTLTTTGDIYYASGANTPARLGIGSTGNVLTVASGIPSWAAASSGAMTKVVSADFSGSTAVAINNCFTSTYTNYILIVSGLGDAGQADVFLQFQTGTNTVYSGSTYYGSLLKLTEAGSVSYVGNNAAQKFAMGTPAINQRYTFTATINNVGDGSRSAAISSVGNMVGGATLQGGLIDATNVYTGLYLTGSGNLTGNYAIYGLVK